VILVDHVHRPAAQAWWQAADSKLAFTRLTAISVLRLLTTHAAMNGKPLSMNEAWQVHDRLFEDDRVILMPEPSGIETFFRRHAAGRTASPKLWGDAWLLAFAEAAGGTVITFDQALAARGAHSLL
jgi:predicted nucleic acid-binding protein